MLISREEYQKKLNLMRRMINAFMCLCLLLPLVGIVALVTGVVQPGDGKGSMTTVEVSLILASISVLIRVLWKLFTITLNWIARRQISLLFIDARSR
jgi:ABC-type sulfate transport system permease component